MDYICLSAKKKSDLCVYLQVEQAAKDGNCCFGTVDTWLLYKLTKGEYSD